MDPAVRSKTVRILETYLPLPAAPVIAQWIDQYHTVFHISKRRSTKLGDYRPPYQGKGHRISVNYNLNPFSFLVTVVHEFAHLTNFNKHQGRVKPHGAEWKVEFRTLVTIFFDMNIFPSDVSTALKKYLVNPAASSCTDLSLMKVLSSYDQRKENETTVEQLPAGQIFKIKDGRRFRKEEKIRKRIRCTEVGSGRIYLFHPLAEVVL